jgi:hypothetical protein
MHACYEVRVSCTREERSTLSLSLLLEHKKAHDYQLYIVAALSRIQRGVQIPNLEIFDNNKNNESVSQLLHGTIANESVSEHDAPNEAQYPDEIGMGRCADVTRAAPCIRTLRCH